MLLTFAMWLDNCGGTKDCMMVAFHLFWGNGHPVFSDIEISFRLNYQLSNFITPSDFVVFALNSSL